jgi:hypothetical protein
MAHGKILTAENLAKRGIQGPSRCALCLDNAEIYHHIFFKCKFSSQVLKQALKEIEHLYRRLESWKSLFSKWGNMYQGSFKNKPLPKRLWISLPKYICWEMCFARNWEIFQQE